MVHTTLATDDVNDEELEVCAKCGNDDFKNESKMFHEFEEPGLHFNQFADCGNATPTQSNGFSTISDLQLESLKYAAMLACRDMLLGASGVDKEDFLHFKNKAVTLAIDCGLDEKFITTLKEIE